MLVKVDKDFVFDKIAEIYDLVEENTTENDDYRYEVLEELANLQAYVKESDEGDINYDYMSEM